MEVLVVAPHMDDEVLGVGGTVARHVYSGDRVTVCIVANRAYNQLMPNVAYVNHGADLNQDHQAVFSAAMIVCRPHASHKLEALYCYETPSSTDQAPALPAYAFQPTHYVGIENYLEQKLAAFNCYETESRSFPHPRSREGITVYAKKRGSEIGLPAAEAFILLRNVVA
jgi:LmbE family N-acetylglucosaminyl deacetylase